MTNANGMGTIRPVADPKVVPRDSSQSRAAVFLTFDDGPDRDWTPRVLDLLAQADIRATFFVIGESARREPALLQRVAAAGHAIGNHTRSHRHPWTMSCRAARNEVRDGADIIAQIIGQWPQWYRAPHGRDRRCMTDEAAQVGAKRVNWSLSAVDWGPLGTAARIARRLQQVRSGDIVLMHDGRNRSNRPDELLRVLPTFLDDLSSRRLNPVALSA